jgi:DnaJ homolog subfamily C member 9
LWRAFLLQNKRRPWIRFAMTKKQQQEQRHDESSLIEQVFGAGACLYTTVLGCSSSGPTVSAALIRKAYYRSALKYHPDKQKGNGDDNQRFLAISMAYQILSNEESRRDYDETGVIPTSTNDDDEDDFGADGTYASNVNKWKQYFGSIFGTVTNDKIDSFKQQYKCSDEEGRDVWREFIRHGGNCHAMLNHVMCSELVDVPRWITDYIQPALLINDVAESVRATLTKTAAECQRKLDQQQSRAAGKKSKQASPPRRSRGATAQAKRSKTDETDEEDEEDADQDETTTTEEENEEHESDQEVQPVRKAKTKKVAAKKSGDLDAALVAQIRGKSNNSDALWANIEARYAHDKKRKLPDPLTDEQFDQVQARLLSNKTNKFKGTKKK